MQPSLIDTRYVTLHEGEQPIPGFRLVRRRGRGGFGEVWEAEASGGFLVALKFVRLSHCSRSAELRALEFVRGIHHPNLLANFGSWLVDETLIIGMELADRSLWDRHVEATRQGYLGIPRGELLGYLSEVAAGIDHLNDYRHTFDGRPSMGVQHRDLKPPNILLFGGGAKVADLGMARAMEGEVGGHTGVWTFPYAAPEFFRGETTRQSDQYGLAATYCQLRGGQLPFTGSAATVTAGHLFGQPDLEALPALERPIVERALAKTPGDRWPNCRAFVAALRDLPADAVPDVLVDPDGHYSSPHYFELTDGGSSPSGGWVSSGSEVLPVGWLQTPLDTSVTADPDRPDTMAGIETFLPVIAPTPAHPSDQIPTRILPAPSSHPQLAGPPQLPRRRAWLIRATLAVAASALVLATVALYASAWSEAPRIAQVPTSSAATLAAEVLAVDPAPARSDDDALEAPLVAVEVPAAPERDELIAEPGVALLPPLNSEPLRPEPIPSVALAVDGPPTLAAPPAAAEIPSPPAPLLEDQLAPALAGPIDMGALTTQPTARLPVPPEPGASRPTTRPIPALPPTTLAALPPDPGLQAKAMTPPVPDRSVVDLAARPVALIASTATSVVVPKVAAARTTPTNISAEAAFARGRDLFQQHAFARAVAEFDESIRLDPHHVTSYLVRAIARHRAGDPRAALPDYAEVIRARPDDITAYLSRGQAYHELGAFDRAIGDFNEVIRRQSSSGEAHFRRGLARFHAGDHSGSVTDFTTTLRLDPNHPYAAEFRSEASARLATRQAQASAPNLAAPGPQTTPKPNVISPPGQAGTAPGPPALRETVHVAPPSSGAAPAGQPKTTPPPTDRRRGPVRRVLPWPFAKGR